MLQRGLAVAVIAAASIAPAVAAATPHITAVRASTAPVIDGRLDDDAWRHAEFTTDFRQSDPHWGEPSTRRTEVAFVFDGRNLYEPDVMRALGFQYLAIGRQPVRVD